MSRRLTTNRTRIIAAGFFLLGVTVPAGAREVLTPQYDALGRVTQMCHAKDSSAELAVYGSDSRDNRSSYSNTRTDFVIPPNSSVTSGDGRFKLTMQGDGNLVLYQNGTALWASGTQDSRVYGASFQSDGNLVIYSPSGAIWTSGTANTFCASLNVQSDGNVVIYSSAGKPVWSTNTGGH